MKYWTYLIKQHLFMARAVLCALLLNVPTITHAADVSVVGLFPGKALIAVGGQSPRAIAVGSSLDGVKVISVDGNGATLEVNGRRQYIPIGGQYASPGASASSGTAKSVTLTADAQGHFSTLGSINKLGGFRFLVDTGATSVALGMADAQRLGLDLKQAQRTTVGTANGVVQAYVVKLDSVTIGDVTLYGVEGLVAPNMGGAVLLGMSFLNRMQMKRDGQTMVLTQRY